LQQERTLTLYIAHRRKLVDYATAITADPGRAEDVVQEAFLRFKAAAATRLLEEPVGYLYRVVRNLALDRRRRAALENRHVLGDVERVAAEVPEEAPSPEREAIARDQLQRVLAAMDRLPERTRIALEMHRFGGCTLKQIAEHFDISVSMAHVLVTDGVRHCLHAL
jgi:RNA polymerase sigma factor (sigma-70 family)